MLDGASIHGKNELAKWCERRQTSLIMNWPAHSPDLNPIENVFSLLKDRIGKALQLYDVRKIEDSKARIRDARDRHAKKIAKATCTNLVQSFKTRLRKCVTLKGEHTGY